MLPRLFQLHIAAVLLIYEATAVDAVLTAAMVIEHCRMVKIHLLDAIATVDEIRAITAVDAIGAILAALLH